MSESRPVTPLHREGLNSADVTAAMTAAIGPTGRVQEAAKNEPQHGGAPNCALRIPLLVRFPQIDRFRPFLGRFKHDFGPPSLTN